MKLHVYKNKEELSYELALWIANLISSTLKKQDFFSLVLSGGNTPKSLYIKLAEDEFKKIINWKKVYIFWGDERYVPFDDSRNNAKMAFETLLNKIDIPRKNINEIKTDITPQKSAEQYENTIKTYFEETKNYFDLVLLGIGDDGHTLSIFPNSPLINEEEKWVCAAFNDEQKMYRITLMPALINNSKNIAFMVEGTNKAEVLNRIIYGNVEPLKFPSQLISAIDGELHWFLDEEAASRLSKDKEENDFLGHVL